MIRPPFVTRIAFAFVFLYAVATLGSAYTLVGFPAPDLPAHGRPLLAAVLLVDVVTLLSAIGLLRRRTWALNGFVASLLASLVVSAIASFEMTRLRATLWPGLVGGALLYGLLIAKLLSAPIRAEFEAPPRRTR